MKITRAQVFRLVLGLAILLSCIGCDQVAKKMARQSLRHAPVQSYFADTIRLQYVVNPGAFLGLGSDLPRDIRPLVLIGFNACLILGVAVFIFSRHDMPWALFVAVACILAGGIGNLIDRVSNHGLVTDFINVGIGPLRTGIFNIADIAVMFGSLAVVFLLASPKITEQATAPELPTDSNGSSQPPAQ